MGIRGPTKKLVALFGTIIGTQGQIKEMYIRNIDMLNRVENKNKLSTFNTSS